MELTLKVIDSVCSEYAFNLVSSKYFPYILNTKLQMPPIHDEHADIYYSDGHGLKRDCVFV